jgi:hypothetical protein
VKFRFFKINPRLCWGRPAARQFGIASLDNVESSTSLSPIGLHGLLRGQLYFFFLVSISDLAYDASCPGKRQAATSVCFACLLSGRLRHLRAVPSKAMFCVLKREHLLRFQSLAFECVQSLMIKSQSLLDVPLASICMHFASLAPHAELMNSVSSD